MSKTEAAKEKAAEIGAELIGRLVELGGRGLEGLFTSPWTGVPFALIILSQIDPSGKLTAQFLTNLASFLGSIGKMLSDAITPALSSIGKGIAPPPIVPPITVGSGGYCYKFTLNGYLKFFLSLNPAGPAIKLVPDGDICFVTPGERDSNMQAFKDSLGPAAPFYDFTAYNK